MTTVTPPNIRIPIGRVTVGGVTQDVAIHPEFHRFLMFDLFRRAGGTQAPSNLELDAVINQVRQSSVGIFYGEDDDEPGPSMIPGPAGADGAPAALVRGIAGEDGEHGLPFFLQRSYRVPVDASAARVLNTTYTNISTDSLMVCATVRCSISMAAGNAYVQAKMDTASPPTVNASGLVGIEAGLIGEDNSFQITFVVNPGGTYRINSTATNGAVVLGKWFEFSL